MRTFQERLQSRLDIGRVLKSNDLQPKDSLTVVEHGRGQSFDAAKLLLQVVSRHSKWIVNANSFRKLQWVFHVRHGVEFESACDKPIGAISVCEALIAGHFLLARLAPRRPEVNQHDFAMKIFDGEIRQARTNFTCGAVVWWLRRTRRVLIAPEESDQTETQKQNFP